MRYPRRISSPEGKTLVFVTATQLTIVGDIGIIKLNDIELSFRLKFANCLMMLVLYDEMSFCLYAPIVNSMYGLDKI